MSAPVPDVKAATQRAQQELDWLRCHKEASLEAWQEHVRAYVLERFLLDRKEEEEGIIPLAQKSVEKLTGIPRETLAAADRPSGCTAATAVLDTFAFDFVFNWPGLVFYLSVAALFVFLTAQTVQKRRWN